jgi:hypothetical protein
LNNQKKKRKNIVRKVDFSNSSIEQLPTEKELDFMLKDIFNYYVELGDKSGNTYMGRLRFRRFVKDCKLLGPDFPSTEADLVFADVTSNGSILMKYTVFCNALTMLAAKKFPKLETHDSLKKILLKYVLPNAKRHDIKSRGVKKVLSDEIMKVLQEKEKPLRRVKSIYFD